MKLNQMKLLKTIFVLSFLCLLPILAFSQTTSSQYLAAGNQFYQSQDYAKAVLYYKAAVQTDPQNANAYQCLGSAYYKMGNYADAITAYDKSLALNPNNPQLANFDQNLKIQHPQASANSNSALGNIELTGSAAPAAPGTSGATNGDSWSGGHDHSPNFFWDIGLGPALGNGGGFALASEYYIALDKNFSIGLSSNFYIFSATAAAAGVTVSSTTYLAETLLMFKYVMDGKAIRPYLMAGAGVDFYGTTSSTSYANNYYGNYGGDTGLAIGINPGLAFGGGLFFPLSKDVGLFAQGQLSLLLSGTTFGENENGETTSSNGGTSFVPIEGGITFPW